MSEVFESEHPRIVVTGDAGGSIAGAIAIKRGAIDIASMSRPLPRNLYDPDYFSHIIAKDGIAIIVNPENPISDISKKQIQDVFAGKIRDWSDLGGPPGEIQLVLREKGSKTRKGIEDIVMDYIGLSDEGISLPTAQDINKHVAENPLAIGYVAICDLYEKVKPLTVNKVEIDNLTILSGRYPLSRSYYLLSYRRKHFEDNELAKENIELFVSFAKSPRGQAILKAEGLLPVYR